MAEAVELVHPCDAREGCQRLAVGKGDARIDLDFQRARQRRHRSRVEGQTQKAPVVFLGETLTPEMRHLKSRERRHLEAAEIPSPPGFHPRAVDIGRELAAGPLGQDPERSSDLYRWQTARTRRCRQDRKRPRRLTP